jgi:hypothetical protein
MSNAEFSASTRRSDVRTCINDRGQLTPSVSDTCLLVSTPDNSSSRQSTQSTRPLLLTAPDFPYACKAFKILIFLFVGTVAAPFIVMLDFMWSGFLLAGKLFLAPVHILMVGLPIIFGPHFIWFVFMLPLSLATKR